MVRLGTYELRSSRDRAPGTRRRFAGAADCLAFLRSQRLDGAKARALVRSASAVAVRVKSDDDALRALAQLLYRGAYVVYERAPVRVPMLEAPPAAIEDELGEPEFEESETEGHPAAIVPPEYPRMAATVEGGLWAAVENACSEIEEWRHRSMPRMNDDEVPAAHRLTGEKATEAIVSATSKATSELERLEYNGMTDAGYAHAVSETFRDVASTKGTDVGSVVGQSADALDALRYSDLQELAGTERRLHSDEGVPRVYRQTSEDKGKIVRDSTGATAGALDQLLYQGFEPA